MGLADHLERGAVSFYLGAVDVSQGVSVIDEATDGARVSENLTMFNAEVVLERQRPHLAVHGVLQQPGLG